MKGIGKRLDVGSWNSARAKTCSSSHAECVSREPPAARGSNRPAAGSGGPIAVSLSEETTPLPAEPLRIGPPRGDASRDAVLRTTRRASRIQLDSPGPIAEQIVVDRLIAVGKDLSQQVADLLGLPRLTANTVQGTASTQPSDR